MSYYLLKVLTLPLLTLFITNRQKWKLSKMYSLQHFTNPKIAKVQTKQRSKVSVPL